MKTAFITGANSGIGLATVKLFLSKSYRVIAHYHSDNSNLLALAGGNLFCLQADLSKADEVKNLIDKACIISPIDVLVNNAGSFKIASNFEDVAPEDYDYVMNVNLKAPFTLCQAVLPYMQGQNFGRIVNISSIGVKFGGSASSSPYSMSKSGLETLSISLGREFSKFNILVNALRVGVTKSKFHDLNPEKSFDQRCSLIPMQRAAEPDEIAQTILFLCSEECSFIAGSIVTAAGGE